MRRSHSSRAPAKAKLASSIETQPGVHLAALAAFCVVGIPIMATRNENVGRERIVLGFHCHKLRLNIMYRRSESFQCLLKACRTHDCSIETY
jgi:hypothetical protein